MLGIGGRRYGNYSVLSALAKQGNVIALCQALSNKRWWDGGATHAYQCRCRPQAANVVFKCLRPATRAVGTYIFARQTLESGAWQDAGQSQRPAFRSSELLRHAYHW